MRVRFPYSHDLAQLLTLVEQSGLTVPGNVKQAAGLSDYAVQLRYPGVSEPVVHSEYENAHITAEQVVRWAEDIINRRTERDDNDAPEEGVIGEQ